MKIGILGGSFNPAHLGHIYISNLALENCKLDKIWWVPTVQNPFKDKQSYAPFETRFESCLEITKNHPKIIVKNFAQESFVTYELVKKIQAENLQTKFCFVMGADNLEKFHLWKNFLELINLIEFAIFSRGDYLQKAKQTKAWQLYEEIISRQNSTKNLPKFSLFQTKNYDISSSEIRQNS